MDALQHCLRDFDRGESSLAIGFEQRGRGQGAKVRVHSPIISPSRDFCEQTCDPFWEERMTNHPYGCICCSSGLSRRQFLKAAALAAPALSACTTMGQEAARAGPILIKGGTVLSV